MGTKCRKSFPRGLVAGDILDLEGGEIERCNYEISTCEESWRKQHHIMALAVHSRKKRYPLKTDVTCGYVRVRAGM